VKVKHPYLGSTTSTEILGFVVSEGEREKGIFVFEVLQENPHNFCYEDARMHSYWFAPSFGTTTPYRKIKNDNNDYIINNSLIMVWY